MTKVAPHFWNFVLKLTEGSVPNIDGYFLIPPSSGRGDAFVKEDIAPRWAGLKWPGKAFPPSDLHCFPWRLPLLQVRLCIQCVIIGHTGQQLWALAGLFLEASLVSATQSYNSRLEGELLWRFTNNFFSQVAGDPLSLKIVTSQLRILLSKWCLCDVNSAARNTGMQTSLWNSDFISFGQITRSEIFFFEEPP